MSSFVTHLDPDLNSRIVIYFFKDVKNAGLVRQYVIDNEWKCALVKPDLICDPMQIVIASNKAALSNKSKTLVTKTVFTEILYNLSLTNSISAALKKFGVQKEDKFFVVFIVNDKWPENKMQYILSRIDGDLVKVDSWFDHCNMKEIKKEYKITELSASNVPVKTYCDIILSKMSVKNIT